MIIDRILDRHDDEKRGNFNYNAHDFYFSVFSYDGKHADDITRAMDAGTEEETRKALFNYIDDNGYNSSIKDYINSRIWNANDKRIKAIINI